MAAAALVYRIVEHLVRHLFGCGYIDDLVHYNDYYLMFISANYSVRTYGTVLIKCFVKIACLNISFVLAAETRLSNNLHCPSSLE